MVVVKAGSRSTSWLLALLLAASGCGYEGELPTPPAPPSPPSPPTEAAIVLSLVSSPVDAVVVEDGGAGWSAEWTLVVNETAGIGGSIDFVQATLTDSTGEEIAETELDPGQLGEQLGGSNHIEGGSSHEILMNMSFDFPADALSGDLEITLQLSDDRGNTVSATAADVIQVCVPRLLSPEEGAVLDNGCTDKTNGILWEFGWSECPDAEAYELWVQLGSAQEPLVDRRGLTTTSYSVLENSVIFEEARYGWFWKVRAKINDIWGDWSPERNFDVEPLDTDCTNP